MRLTTLFEVRLSKTSPAPLGIHSFTVVGTTPLERNKSYLAGVKAMRGAFPNHRYFKLLLVTDDLVGMLSPVGISTDFELPELETE